MIEFSLIIAISACIILIYKISQISQGQKVFKKMELFIGTLIIWCLGLLLQRIVINMNINIKPIYLDYITYIGICFAPPIAVLMSIEYGGFKVNKIIKSIIFVIPVICLLFLWTNDWHQMFYKVYSLNFNDTVYGPIFNLNMIYSYVALGIFMIMMATASIRKSGFFSVQTMLIIFGSLVPLCVNMLGTLKIISISIYITPILFVITLLCYALAIIKFKALNIIPVAFKTIIDTMSDSFIVVSEDGTIADLNKTFIEKFKSIKEFKDKDNLFELLKDSDAIDVNQIKADIQEAKKNNSTITKEYHIEKGAFDKYFEIDFEPIKAKDGSEFVATLMLLRDTTTAKRDMEIMMKNENLVILGELAGGVAHDINTPISAIKSGLLMVKDMVPTEDGKMLVSRMDSCADKIVTLTNSLRNQIRNIGSEEVVDINVANVIADVQIITHNELMSKNVKINVDKRKDIVIKGSPTKLSQVITNLIVNSIQAYGDKGGGMIDIVIDKEGDNAIITIEDWAGGISESIRPYIFKNILTTKGVSGTGFGLYLAYSVIKGAFGGEITFETVENKGTRFEITIPLNKVEK